ncbi:hypothetical protein JKP88DRAFT_284100 [Tribonema minus]|uniref:RRM domain-containing protein n=1 Tax=Tribonema minus TaxID=303371 RepID=A0A835YI48_9STRA|nr:hypothetical protein JKP88DRAFT_284100 [Tribonema minus]
MARKRRGRRRGRWSQHPDWHVYYRQANEEDAKQAEMEREIEEQDAQHQADLAERGSQLECRVAFVGNLPYSATAAQLQLFLEQRLQASTIPRMSGEALVVHVDLKMSKGFAFVGFASTECKEYLKLAAARIPGLLFLGRRMRMTALLQLRYSLDGLIDDFFDSETETKYKAQLRFSDIMSRRGVELKKGPDDSMALVLTLRRPPHLYQMKPPNALQKMGLEPYDERDDRTWTRTSEQHGAQLAHAARLCRTREVYLNTMDKLDPVFAAPVLAESPFGACAPAALQARKRAEHSQTLSARAARLPFALQYALCCAVLAYKMDVLAVGTALSAALEEAPEADAVLALLDMANHARQRFQDPLAFVAAALARTYAAPPSATNDSDSDSDGDSAAAAAAAALNLDPDDPLFGVDRPQSLIMVPRAFVTPLRVIVLPPEQEGLNRVLRHYREFGHRFLRVAFSIIEGPDRVLRHYRAFGHRFLWVVFSIIEGPNRVLRHYRAFGHRFLRVAFRLLVGQAFECTLNETGSLFRVSERLSSYLELVQEPITAAAAVELETGVEEVNAFLSAAASEGPLKGERSDVMDAPSTTVVNGTCVTLHVWYDSESFMSPPASEALTLKGGGLQQKPIDQASASWSNGNSGGSRSSSSSRFSGTVPNSSRSGNRLSRGGASSNTGDRANSGNGSRTYRSSSGQLRQCCHRR